MSLNLDDWLKPSDEQNEPTNPVVDVGDDEDPITNSLSAADLQLPDLGLPDIKWWVDLEFLDLASGPPANINSGQERNKNRHNPTLGNYFPDIFFDTTGQGSSSLFANDDTNRSLIGDQAFENFEKGLLADLFPSTSTGNEDKLLEDFPEISANATAPASESSAVAHAVPSAKSAEEIIKVEKTSSVQNEVENATKTDDESAYSVPLDVLQSLSKNFEKLQADFEKSTTVTTDSENRIIRIKSIRTVPPDADIEHDIKTPKGTVATIAIQTNKANNTTTFTILPRLGQTPKQSFLVKTHNLSQATKMIRPLHLDRLPVFKNLFNNIRVIPPTEKKKVLSRAMDTIKENVEKKIVRDKKELANQLLDELKQFGAEYDKIPCQEFKDGKIQWSCPEADCKRHFPKRSQLKLHIFSHKGIKPFKCSQADCKWSFPTMVKLKRHEKTHLGVKLFKCNMSGCEDRAFTTIYNLNTHIKEHAKEEHFKCSICDMGFRGQRLLDLHLRNVHEKNVNYVCTEANCSKAYSTQVDLTRHKKNHHQMFALNRFMCASCAKVFPNQSRLDQHERIHNGQRPFACQFEGCQWAFRTSSKLRRHERSHKGDRRYVCHVCGKSYLRPDHLKEHVEIIHKNQKLACPIDHCTARFTQKPSLAAHVKKHWEDPKALDHSRYRCVIEKCGQKFQSKRNLTQHVNREHQPELVTNVQDQSELDLIALLSCVAADDIKMSVDQQNETKEELITVDASAITPIKVETKEGPNIISKSRNRKRKKGQVFKICKKVRQDVLEDDSNSTINMQDLA